MKRRVIKACGLVLFFVAACSEPGVDPGSTGRAAGASARTAGAAGSGAGMGGSAGSSAGIQILALPVDPAGVPPIAATVDCALDPIETLTVQLFVLTGDPP